MIVAMMEHVTCTDFVTRYFIVIDGLWDVSVWHIIKRAFPAGNQRIITTTSVENVAQFLLQL